MFSEFRPALTLLVILTAITGIVYPLVVTQIAQTTMPHKANGSLIMQGDKVVGSELIGQPFGDPKYFWGRASGTSPFPYNAGASSGTNQGPLNPALTEAVEGRVKALREADPDNKLPVPIDLVTASGSGLDPHISPAAAEYQVGRIARVRKLDQAKVSALIVEATESRTLGFLGEPRVNVLRLNLALDAIR